jgi:putative (di)nucleoside polyphosphate hydrolase
MSPLPLRPNVCMILMNKQGEVLLGERISNPGAWQFPQGGVEPEQTPEESVYRELEEELGIVRSLLRIITKLQATNEYEFRITPPYAINRWRGQSQTFWLVQFLGSDQDIRVETAHQEFMSWRWAPLSTVLTEVEEIRQQGYRAAIQEIQELLRQGSLIDETA